MTYKETLKVLPASWEEVNLKTYQRLISAAQYDIEPLEEGTEEYTLQLIDNSLVTIAALVNTDISSLRGLLLTDSMDLIKRTKWVSIPPVPLKVKPKYIKDNIKITVDNYLAYQAKASNGKELDNIKDIVGMFIKDVPCKKKGWFNQNSGKSKPMLTDEDIDNMNMVEIFTFFFFVQKLLLKSLKRIQYKMTTKLKILVMLQKLGAKQA